MAFSQSLSLGENTLNQLDVCEGNIHYAGKSVNENKAITPTRKRSQKPLNGKPTANQSPTKDAFHSNKILDVVDESPTEKTNVLGKSIRERLKNASTSKKNDRKHMRRSRSDPISASDSKISKSSLYRPSFTEEYDCMFDSSMELTEPDDRGNKKTKIKLDEKFEEDDFDMFFGDILTPGMHKNDEQGNDTKSTASLIALSDSDGSDQVNVSDIEKLIRTENNFDKTADPSAQVDNEQPKDEIEWEDSAFFNDLLASQPNDVNAKAIEEKKNSMADIVIDAECVSMPSVQNDDERKMMEENLEDCFLEVSIHLSNLNATEVKTVQRSGSQLECTFSRSITERVIALDEIAKKTDMVTNLSMVRPNKLSIENLADWGCTAPIIKSYKKKGIHEMFEWQEECLSIPKIKDGDDNLLYSAPTSAGKTFVSEIVMFQTVLKRQKKVIVILPFVSVVREKMYSLQDLLRSSGIRVEGFFGGYTAPGGFESADIAICTIEKANAIINRLLEQQNIDAIGMVVVDEVHLISDSNRGYILELLLTKILFCSRKLGANIRIVAMSATLPNSKLVQNWLNSQFYRTNYRPIELREMIKIGTNIYDNGQNLIRMISNEDYSIIGNDQDNIAQLCIETIVNSASVIVFCPSKDWCESLALHVAQNIYKLGKSQTSIGEKIRKEINMPKIEEVKGHLRNSPAGLDSVLEKTISYAVAYHHAGLTFDERDIIESSFCNSSIRVIIATSTLSSGVNLPARRVIIRSPMQFGRPMCSLTYKQMIGRAGRMGKDTEGESILICDKNNARVGQELIGATLKPITSCLSSDNHIHLKRALLEIIASGVATTRSELENFVKCTLYYSEHKFEIKYFTNILNEYKTQSQLKKKIKPDIGELDEIEDTDLVGKCMRFLERYEFIRLQLDEETDEIKFLSTRLGYACLASSMPPSDGFFLFSELQKARQNFVLETELHAIYLVTPLSVCYQLQDIDWLFYLDMWEKLSNSMQRVGELVGVKESFLVKAMRGTTRLDNRTLQIHKRFYTALVLNELINECPLNQVAMKYKMSRGTLQSLQQTTSTFAGIVKSFCKALNWDMLALIVSQFQDRIFFGVHQDLIELMKISVLNGQRARALFDAGYQTLVDISKANVLDIEKCLTDSISFDVKKRDGETNYDAEQRNKHRLLFVTGRAGLTPTEAAKLIIDEAREYLRTEMGIQNINWTQRDEKTTVIEDASDKLAKNSLNEDAARDTKVAIDSIELVKKTENTKNTVSNDRQPAQKRRISMDERVMTPNKKRNHGQMVITARKTSSGESSSSENSEVDSIILDNSLSFYNDENDDFLRQLQSISNSPVLANGEHSNGPQLQIVDVTKTLDEFKKFVKTFEKVMECGFSLATARPDIMSGSKSYRCVILPELYLYGVAISFEDKYTTHFISLQDDNSVDFRRKCDFIQTVMSRKKLTLICNDSKTQLKTLLKAIPEIQQIDCLIEDPLVAQWLIQPEDYNNRTFGKMIKIYAPKCIDLSSTICNGRMSTTTTTKIRSSIKACIVRQIIREQLRILREMGNGSIYKAFKEMEMPVQKTLLHMEQTGMALERNALEVLSDQISDYIGELEAEIFRLNGKRFAINSSRQVAQALGVRKKNGSIAAKCTRVQLLQIINNPMAPNCKLAKLTLEHRSLHAILSKSVQPLIKMTSDDDRIYGSSYSFTQTGRISMHEPNLQNVAKDFKTEFKSQLFSCRSAFILKQNRALISADFCQLELRVLAHLSEDDSLIRIFSATNDVFISIAAKWNKVREIDVTDKMRNDTKQICYGIIYGMGIKSLAATMKCDEEEAQLLHESFHQTYPGIRNYTQKILYFARENGFVETIAGRRRYMPDINAINLRKRAQAERQAINTTIQGSAADIAKYAILRMERNLIKYQPQLHTIADIDLVLHLHDELLYEVPSEKAIKVLKILKSSMENCAKLLVPLKVKMKMGQCWGTMERIELQNN